MEVGTYVRILLRQWWIVLGTLALFVLAAVVFTDTRAKVYESTATGLVSYDQAPGANVDRSDLDQVAQSRATTYAALATTNATAVLAAADLKSDASPRSLLTHITVEQTPDTALISISARESSANRASALADAWLQALSTRVAQIEDAKNPDIFAPHLSEVEKAIGPTSPVYPRPAVTIGIGVIAGLTLGVVGALVFDSLRRRIGSPRQISERWGAALLAELPRLKGRRARLIPIMTTLDDAGGVQAVEQLREARLKLSHAEVGNAPRVIVVSAPARGQGTSTVALDLASTYVAAGQPTVVVEADLLHPALARDLGLDPDRGLWQVLLGQVRLEEALQSVPSQPGLRVLVAGARSPAAAEIVGSAAMVKVLSHLRNEGQVLVDTPAILLSSVAPVLCQHADGIVVVIARRPRVAQVSDAFDKLEVVGAAVLGVISSRPRRTSRRRDRGMPSVVASSPLPVIATSQPVSRRPPQRRPSAATRPPGGPSRAVTTVSVPSPRTDDALPGAAVAVVAGPRPLSRAVVLIATGCFATATVLCGIAIVLLLS